MNHDTILVVYADLRRSMVSKPEDNAFIVEVPELPGCMANGETYEEAVKNALIVIDEWIETARDLGRDIPQPRGKLMYA